MRVKSGSRGLGKNFVMIQRKNCFELSGMLKAGWDDPMNRERVGAFQEFLRLLECERDHCGHVSEG